MKEQKHGALLVLTIEGQNRQDWGQGSRGRGGDRRSRERRGSKFQAEGRGKGICLPSWERHGQERGTQGLTSWS